MKGDWTHIKLEKSQGHLSQRVLGEVRIPKVVLPKDSHFVWQRFQGVLGGFTTFLGVWGEGENSK